VGEMVSRNLFDEEVEKFRELNKEGKKYEIKIEIRRRIFLLDIVMNLKKRLKSKFPKDAKSYILAISRICK